ncbi:MAG TPA: hypothetical protein VJT49_34750 [Amycolatopsis sp.]|uniref:hypothetical protein n=1 Tax=Amycolatopsis sp. TaxID=37632 RepID=UPI002B47954E|nr:hypothetical protein [Amycolatopsis sp.]HKS50181.1 hypothetical protein [Amycolatopsis sp.]
MAFALEAVVEHGQLDRRIDLLDLESEGVNRCRGERVCPGDVDLSNDDAQRVPCVRHSVDRATRETAVEACIRVVAVL